MKKQPAGFKGQYAETDFDYCYRGTQEVEDGQLGDIYSSSAAPIQFKYPSMGRFLDSYHVPESGIGTYELIGRGFFACVYRDSQGPFSSRGLADEHLHQMLQRNRDYTPVVSRALDQGLVAMLIIYAALGLLAWLIYQAFELWR